VDEILVVLMTLTFAGYFIIVVTFRSKVEYGMWVLYC
jgi:hypothetical protein